MNINQKIFKNSKILPVDQFFNRVLYDKKIGYYSSRNPFESKGDFITAPNISHLFSEMIAIWIILTWEKLKKPKKINIIELGPGNGKMAKVLCKTFEKFPAFSNRYNLYLYEKSDFLKKVQKKEVYDFNVKWINSFNNISKFPVIFIGNEFIDAIPIKQFIKQKNIFYEKYFFLENNKIKEKLKKINKSKFKLIQSFKSLKNNKFIEFPHMALKELDKITKSITKRKGAILLIDYGYLKQNNKSTLQSVKKHKINKLFKNLGKADITSLVNFELLKEYFNKRKFKTNKVKTQSQFLKLNGIIKRAEIISKKMNFYQKSDLYFRLKRLLHNDQMGDLFKVIEAIKKG
jgi:NADH dehydrogenase [ubiquinone] 1 alpha subcomplex assembly factor 7